MSSIDFTHIGPHDDLVPGVESQGRSRAGRIAGTLALAAIGLALMALRYWLFLPTAHHSLG